MNNLHFHDGSTCHGSPTLAEALRYALNLGEELDIVERSKERGHKCYSPMRLARNLGYPRGRVYGRIVTRIRYKVVITGRRK